MPRRASLILRHLLSKSDFGPTYELEDNALAWPKQYEHRFIWVFFANPMEGGWMWSQESRTSHSLWQPNMPWHGPIMGSKVGLYKITGLPVSHKKTLSASLSHSSKWRSSCSNDVFCMSMHLFIICVLLFLLNKCRRVNRNYSCRFMSKYCTVPLNSAHPCVQAHLPLHIVPVHIHSRRNMFLPVHGISINN